MHSIIGGKKKKKESGSGGMAVGLGVQRETGEGLFCTKVGCNVWVNSHIGGPGEDPAQKKGHVKLGESESPNK